MVENKLQDLIEGYVITLNGINAEVYKCPEGILLTNNDYADPDLKYDELVLPYNEFKKQLIERDGRF